MTTVPLSKTYTEGNAFSAVTLREPTYREIYMDGLGQPQGWLGTGKGGAALITYPDTVDAYLQRLVIEPGYEYIGQLSAADSLKLERAVCAFFSGSSEPKKSPTGSSSSEEPQPQTSSE